MSNELEERLKATHIPETLDEMKKETEEKPVSKDDPKMQRKYSFSFNWTDARGKKWEGNFVNQIPSIRDKTLIGLLRSNLCNNLPIESLDSFTVELNIMLANMAYSLIEKPDWAKDLFGLHDPDLIAAIYEEVASHEATFFGRK